MSVKPIEPSQLERINELRQKAERLQGSMKQLSNTIDELRHAREHVRELRNLTVKELSELLAPAEMFVGTYEGHTC